MKKSISDVYLSEVSLIKLGFSQAEIKLINLFIENKNIVLEIEDIESKIGLKHIKVILSRIKRKANKSGFEFKVNSVRGVGYIYFGEGE